METEVPRTWGDFAVEVAVAVVAGWVGFRSLTHLESFGDFIVYVVFGFISVAFAMAAIEHLASLTKGGRHG